MLCAKEKEWSDGKRQVRRPASLVCLLLVACCSLHEAQATGRGVWKKQSSGTMAWLRAVQFLDAQRGWAVGGRSTLLLTTDGGKSWTAARRRPVEDALLRDVHFTDAQTGWLVCERNIYQLRTEDEKRSFLLKTTDGGETWTRVEVMAAEADGGARLIRVVFADGERGWVFGEMGALFATENGGETWTRQRVPTRHLLLGGAFLSREQGWLVGAGTTFLQTPDGGETWRVGQLEVPVEPVVGATRSRYAASAVSNDSAGTAGSAQTGAASNAIAAAVSVRLSAVSFVNARRGWAVGNRGRIYMTSNGGRTWRAQRSNVSADLSDVKFFDELEGWAVGANGTVLHTTDGGINWRTEPSGTTHPLERLSFAGPTRGWAVGFGGTIIAYAQSNDTNVTPAPQLKGITANKHSKERVP